MADDDDEWLERFSADEAYLLEEMKRDELQRMDLEDATMPSTISSDQLNSLIERTKRRADGVMSRSPRTNGCIIEGLPPGAYALHSSGRTHILLTPNVHCVQHQESRYVVKLSVSRAFQMKGVVCM